MSPDSAASTIPSRPRFTWDAKSPPWTDGKGNQEKYKVAVEDWKEFHDTLPITSSNKVVPELQGIVLKSQLYGQAADQCSEITREQLKSTEGVDLIVNTVYRRDFMSVISEAYEGFNKLLNTKRGQNESLQAFETRFSAAASKFNSFSSTTRLPPCITALMLLSNASIENSQRVSALSAAAPAGASFSSQSTNDDFLSVVTYSQVSSIVKQCERADRALSASYSRGNQTHHKSRQFDRKNPSMHTLLKKPCLQCGKYGHWKSAHRNDGNLANGTKSFDTSEELAASLQSKQQGKFNSNGDNAQTRKATVTFNMARGACEYDLESDLGPLVDDGAEYSAIGIVELMCYNNLAFNEIELESIPSSLNGITKWQYGSGHHASDSRNILGSVLLSVQTDSGNKINIRHLVVEGSSQWIIGRNVTSKANILHATRNAIQLISNNFVDHISLVNDGRLSFIPLSRFMSENKSAQILSCYNAKTIEERPWTDVKKIVDKVHRHICGHATYTDIKLLLVRNNIWNNSVDEYLHSIIEKCTSCRATAPPQPNRKVSLSSLSKEFNDTVCIDHFYLDDVRLFHSMDLSTRFSSACVVADASLLHAVMSFETCWLNQFWLPRNIRADAAFTTGHFAEFCKDRDIKLEEVPPSRHSKNAIESKHSIVRQIYLKLKDASKETDNRILALRAVSISNDLYGNNILSAFELAKGYSKPIDDNNINKIPTEILEAQQQIQARRKLALILKSKATIDAHIKPGDMVEVFQKTSMNKRGVWSTPKIVLAVNNESKAIIVPGKGGKRNTVAIENIRLALPNEELISAVQMALDDLEKDIEEGIDNLQENEGIDNLQDSNTSQPDQSTNIEIEDDADFSDCNQQTHGSDRQTDKLQRGDKIDIYWPDDDQYYSGTVKHLHQNGEITVYYDDNDIERLNMDNEVWKFSSDTSLNDNVATANSGQHQSKISVINQEPEELKKMATYFGNKTFLRHEAQGFEQYVLNNAYAKEEESFLKTVQIIPKNEVPPDANIITSHALYKVKINDDSSLKMKARIAPHGNKDQQKDELSSDCTSCPPIGLRIIESIAAIFGWKLMKSDAKTAFLQTGKANRKVYVIPPRESNMRATHVWLLLAAVYGLVNSNAKWQHKSDEAIISLGLIQSQYIPQLFYKFNGNKLILIVAKLVDDLKVAGYGSEAENFIQQFGKIFELGNIWNGPGQMRFFGINTIQDEDFTTTTNADDKIKELTEHKLSRERRRQIDSSISAIEKSAFASINSSLGWLGTAASPLCSFYASYLQQRAPNILVKDVIDQINILRKIKKWGSTISYLRPTDKKEYNISILAFADASKPSENGQIGILVGLLIGDFTEGSIFHAISWISHKSKRPVKSVPAAEILATAEAIDEIKAIKATYRKLLQLDIEAQLCVDSKDLFSSLSTQRNSIDRSIRSDVACIRYEFQTGCINRISWIPGKLNLADPLTKPDSPLTDTLLLTLFTGKLQVNYTDEIDTKESERNFG